MKIIYKSNTLLHTIKETWQGNITINNKFFNSPTPVHSPIADVLRWKLTPHPQKKQKAQENYALHTVSMAPIDKSKDSIIWLGHASWLITIGGITFITDPVFYNIPTAKRLASLPCEIADLTQIDYLLLSHDHRDHCDIKSIKKIYEHNPDIEVLTGLHMKELLQQKVSKQLKVQEAGWYQQYQLPHESIELSFTPAQHWARRGLFDFNKRLWGGFVLKSKTKSLFFSGDTTYGSIFKDIYQTFGAIDVCLLPIGAYSPAFIMAQSHCTPEEAYQIFLDLHGKLFVPMHYGTYDLSDEPLGEPIERITKCFEHDTKRFKRVDVGESLGW